MPGTNIIDSFMEQFTFARRDPHDLVLSRKATVKHDADSRSRPGSMVEAKGSAVVPRYTLQEQLRPLFGKAGPRSVTIGDHPDFAHLARTGGTEDCPIVTMFMDIESSTRLELLYGPVESAKIKNAFLCTAIELVHAFDGHVHRLQGDAVMAFFGRREVRPESAAVDAINCASAIWLFVKSTVIPALQNEGYDEDFGIRIGVDYAPDAHWSAFGYAGVGEVSATGFGVSAAAKLQHSAGRNQVMLGQKLLEFLDLPEVVTKQKTVQRDSEEEVEPFLLPNIRLRDGKFHNYKKALLRAEEYLKCGPLADWSAKYTGDQNFQPLKVDMTVHATMEGPAIAGYSAASTVLPKNHWLRFGLRLPFQPMLPYTVSFEVENHGAEARNASANFDNHSTKVEVATPSQHENIVHWESTKYRGLHYMTITVANASNTITRKRLGVYIE